MLSITSPGTHTLTSDVVTSGMIAVAIEVDNVVLNLNGHAIRCAPSNPASAVTFGVSASGRTNIKIRGGAITGAMFGVHAGYGTGILLEDLSLDGNTYIGANLGWGEGNIVRRCTFRHITGYSLEAYAIAINGIGDYGLIEDCTFVNLYKQPAASGVGEGVGILVDAGGEHILARRNTFTNAELTPNTIAIWSANGGSITVSQSTFTRFTATMVGTGFTDGGGNVIGGAAPPAPSPEPITGKLFRVCVEGVCYEGTLLPVSV